LEITFICWDIFKLTFNKSQRRGGGGMTRDIIIWNDRGFI
jgi:hypothetical protein